MQCFTFIGEKGLPLIGAALQLTKDLRRESGYDHSHIMRDLHYKHGDVYRLKVPGKLLR